MSKNSYQLGVYGGLDSLERGKVKMLAGVEDFFEPTDDLVSNKFIPPEDIEDKFNNGDVVAFKMRLTPTGKRYIDETRFFPLLPEFETHGIGGDVFVESWLTRMLPHFVWSASAEKRGGKMLEFRSLWRKMLEKAMSALGTKYPAIQDMVKVDTDLTHELLILLKDIDESDFDTIVNNVPNSNCPQEMTVHAAIMWAIKEPKTSGVLYTIGLDKAQESKATEAKPKIETGGLKEIDGYVLIAGIYVKKEDYRAMKALLNINNANGVLVGPSGYGKTSLPIAFAESSDDIEWVRVNCSAIRDPEEWFIYREAKDGSTLTKKTDFSKAIEKGNVIVILDEFNRVEPWIANSLLPLMDLGKTTVHDIEIERGDNVTFIATINQGAKFSGVFSLDAALANRMHATFRVSELPLRVEVEVLHDMGVEKRYATKIVNTLKRMREIVERYDEDVDVSTRTAKKIAELIDAGLDLRSAFDYAVVNLVSENSAALKSLVDIASSV